MIFVDTILHEHRMNLVLAEKIDGTDSQLLVAAVTAASGYLESGVPIHGHRDRGIEDAA